MGEDVLASFLSTPNLFGSSRPRRAGAAARGRATAPGTRSRSRSAASEVQVKMKVHGRRLPADKRSQATDPDR